MVGEVIICDDLSQRKYTLIDLQVLDLILTITLSNTLNYLYLINEAERAKLTCFPPSKCQNKTQTSLSSLKACVPFSIVHDYLSLLSLDLVLLLFQSLIFARMAGKLFGLVFSFLICKIGTATPAQHCKKNIFQVYPVDICLLLVPSCLIFPISPKFSGTALIWVILFLLIQIFCYMHTIMNFAYFCKIFPIFICLFTFCLLSKRS